MYIKQVIIEGFKSYKDQTITEPFSPKINCIGAFVRGKRKNGASARARAAATLLSLGPSPLVAPRRSRGSRAPRKFPAKSKRAVGANGSGKSNFFHGAYCVVPWWSLWKQQHKRRRPSLYLSSFLPFAARSPVSPFRPPLDKKKHATPPTTHSHPLRAQ